MAPNGKYKEDYGKVYCTGSQSKARVPLMVHDLPLVEL